jgi:hypothetical protein
MFIFSHSQQLPRIDSPDLLAWGGLASESSDGKIASTSIGISAVCLLALVLVVGFLLKRNASRKLDEDYEMDHERDKLHGCGSDDAVEVHECEATTVSDARSVGWLKGAIISDEEGFM